jgi:hypothetical protein
VFEKWRQALKDLEPIPAQPAPLGSLYGDVAEFCDF